MKAFVIATLFVASCSAYGAISSQYQAHDGLGGYSYGYSDPLSTKHESKAHDGSLHGGYSYVDAHGHVQSVKYVADPHHGFQIVAATNLPKGPVAPVAHAIAPVHYAAPAVHAHWGVAAYAPLAPSKTPEVLAAEHAHFAAHAEAKARLHHHHKRSAYGYAPAIGHNGVPIDTPEVQHEKAQHFAAHQRALQGLPANPLIYTPQIAHQPAAPAYHAPAYNHWQHAPAPAPVNGIPVDTEEVKAAKAHHFALVADAKSKLVHSGAHYAPAHASPSAWNNAGHGYNGPLHYPVIGHNGVPEETHEVKAEKAKHFALVAEAKAHQSHGHYAPAHEDDGSYKPEYDSEHYWH